MHDFSPILRVRLDYCLDRGGRTFWGDQPLTGIGTVVGTEAEFRGRPAGVVTLWEFRDGHQIGPWVEPWFGAEHRPILDRAGNFHVDPYDNCVVFEGSRHNGLVAEFDGPFLIELEEVADGMQTFKSIHWRVDGSAYRVADRDVQQTRAGTFEVNRVASWGTQNEGRNSSKPALGVGAVAKAGEVEIVRKVPRFVGDSEVGPPTFNPFRKTDERHLVRNFGITLNENGAIATLVVGGGGYFELVREADIVCEPISWQLESFDDLRNYAVSSSLRLEIDETSFEPTIAGVGGLDRFDDVKTLIVDTRALRLDQIESLLARPGLRKLDITEYARSGSAHSLKVRELCYALLSRKPDLAITFDKTPLTDEPSD